MKMAAGDILLTAKIKSGDVVECLMPLSVRELDPKQRQNLIETLLDAIEVLRGIDKELGFIVEERG